jgi:linoleoyl-CoA desaturase
VRAICERHGIAYKTDSWGRTLKKALAHVGSLGRQGGSVQGVRDAIREMA